MTPKTMLRLLAALSLLMLAACGSSNKGSPDMATSGDMAQPACVMNPMSPIDILNGCTTSQTGDPHKDAPYYPSLTPNGNLPPLP
jgi:hypothetical protein